MCSDCFKYNVINSDRIHLLYEKVEILDEICKKSQTSKNQEWSFEDKMKLLETMEENQLDLNKVLHRFPNKTAHEIIKNFLLIPLKNFRGVLKLTNQHFENIFKKDFSIKNNTKKEEILPYHVF